MTYDIAQADPYDLTKDFRLSRCVYCDCYEECNNHGNNHLSPLFCPNFFLESSCNSVPDDSEWELY